MKTSVLALESAKISRIGIEIPGEQALKIERPAPAAAKDAKTRRTPKGRRTPRTPKETEETKTPPPAKLAFVGFPPEGKKLKDACAAETIARAVSSIDLEDVRKLAAPPAGDGVSTVKIEMRDGPPRRCACARTATRTGCPSTATGGEGDAKKAAEEIAARTKDWEFKIPAVKAEAILKKRADLLEAPAS